VQNAIQLACDIDGRRHVVANERERSVASQVRDVVGVTSYEVVEPNDGVPIGEKAVTEMRS
jgi:hypothetical protein